MASTSVVTPVTIFSLKKYSIAWTSDSVAGTVSNVLSNTDGAIKFDGMLVRAVFVPGSGGTQPDDNYDFTLDDEDGVDMLAGQGAILDDTNTSSVAPGETLTDNTTPGTLPFGIVGELTLTGSNISNSKTGTVVLYFS